MRRSATAFLKKLPPTGFSDIESMDIGLNFKGVNGAQVV